MEDRPSIIYGIFIGNVCVYVGKCYGQSNVNKRKREHLHYLNNNKHHSKKLQMNYRKYKNLFSFKVLLHINASNDELFILEEEFVKKYDTYNTFYGCNQSRGGKGNKGLKHTDKTKFKISSTKIEGFSNEKYIKTNGEINGQHKLKENEVEEIVHLFYTNKYTHGQIADKYNVIRQTISLIYNGKRWGYLKAVQDWVAFKNKNLPTKDKTILLPSDVYEIKHLINRTKMTNKELSIVYKVAPDTIGRIRNGKRHSKIDIFRPYSDYVS